MWVVLAVTLQFICQLLLLTAHLQVLGILSSPSDDRSVENELVMTLGFDHFELIKELLRNRVKLVWCIKLSRAQVRAATPPPV